ncbi:MAG: A/G-specific adenine glycosylase [Beijerinckiaceae bacterium]
MARKKSTQSPLINTQPAVALLGWYDAHGRALPWRVRSGKADPYRVWLSEIMLQQTTVTAVKPYYEKFLKLWPVVQALAEAPLDDVMRAWAGLGYYSRARNLHACAQRVVTEHGGIFPASEKQLLALPGIGAYTAAAIAAIAFGEKAIVVDGNVERVVSRLFAVETPLPQAKPDLKRLAATLTPDARPGDFAQAMMDLGAMVCTPRNLKCPVCPLASFCAALVRGDAASFPRKAAKKHNVARYGAAFVALDAQNRLFVRTRPAKGLLGGMTEIPGSPWSADFQRHDALQHEPFRADWAICEGSVQHVFTHFPLTLDVYAARVTRAVKANGFWIARDSLNEAGFPTVFRKVAEHGLAALEMEKSIAADAKRKRR